MLEDMAQMFCFWIFVCMTLPDHIHDFVLQSLRAEFVGHDVQSEGGVERLIEFRDEDFACVGPSDEVIESRRIIFR